MSYTQQDQGTKVAPAGTTQSTTPSYEETNGCCPASYQAFIYLAMSKLSEAELKQMMAFSKEMAIAAETEAKTVNEQVDLGVASAHKQMQATVTDAEYGIIGAGITAGTLVGSVVAGNTRYSGKDLNENNAAYKQFDEDLAGEGKVVAKSEGTLPDPQEKAINDKVDEISSSREATNTFIQERQSAADKTFSNKVIDALKVSKAKEGESSALDKVRSYNETLTQLNSEKISSNDNTYNSVVRGMQQAGDAGSQTASNAGKLFAAPLQRDSQKDTTYQQAVQSLNSAIAAMVTNSQTAADEAEAKAAQAANFGDIHI